MKRIVVICAVILALVVVVLGAVPFFVDLNRYKGPILDRIKHATGRQVDFERIDLTVLTGVGARITGLRISDDPSFSRADFLLIDEARVRVALLPLLKKEVRIKALSFVRPRVTLVRRSDGMLSISTLAGKKEPGKKGGAWEALRNFTGGSASVKDGRLIFVDQKAPQGPMTYTLEDVDLEVKSSSADRPLEYMMNASFGGAKGQNASARGTLGPLPVAGEPARVPVELHCIVDPLNLASVPSLAKKNIMGEAKVALDVTGELGGTLGGHAEAGISGLSFAGKDRKKLPAGIALAGSADITLDVPGGVLVVKNGRIEAGKGKGTFSGRIEMGREAPVVKFALSCTGLEPAVLLGHLGLLGEGALQKMALAGTMSLSLEAQGPIKEMEVAGRADMRPMSLRFGGFLDKPAQSPFSVSFAASGTGAAIPVESVEIRLGSLVARGKGELHRDRLGTRIGLELSSDRVSLQEVQGYVPAVRTFSPAGDLKVKAFVGAGGARPFTMVAKAYSDRIALVLARPKGDGRPSKPGMLAEPATAQLKDIEVTLDAQQKNKALAVSGKASSKGGVFMKIPYTAMNMSFDLQGSRLAVTSFNLVALKGSMKADAVYDLKTKAWSARPVMAGIEAGDLLDVYSPFKGVFSGNISGEMELKGFAGQPALSALSGRGKLSVGKGQWKNFDLGGQVLSNVLGLPGAGAIFGLAPSEIHRYETTRFEAMDAQIDLANRVITVDTMRLLNIASGKDTDTESSLKGTVSLETNALDLKGTVVLPKRFSQRIASKAQAFSAVMNDSGRIVLPLRIGGTLKRPIPMVEVRSLGDALIRYSATKYLERGMERLKQKGSLPEGSQETQKALEQTIEGLFKKKK